MTRLSTWLSSAALMFGAGVLTTPASAAPLGNVSIQTQGNVESVHYRRGCYRHRGHLHCPSYRRHSYYDYDYGYPRYGAYYGGGYPYYGYGYGPSIAFSFGGGRHYGGGHRWGGGRHWGGRGRW